ESIVKPEALEETQPPLADGKLNVVHQDRLSPGYCLSQTASIPTGRVIHQRIVDDDHCISSASSRIYDGPDPFPGRTPSASCRCSSIPLSTKTLIAELSCRFNFPYLYFFPTILFLQHHH